MESWRFRFGKLSPLGYALVFLGICSIGFGLMFALIPHGELRKGAGIFFVVFSLGIAGAAYWGRRREDAGGSQVFLPKQSPAVAAIVAFLLATLLAASYAYFTDPQKNALLYGAFMGSFIGLLTYRSRRGVKASFPSFLAIFFPLLAVYIVLSLFLAPSQ